MTENKETYISANIKGGLGNQLFQIGFAYVMGKKYNMKPVFKKIKDSYSVLGNRPVYWDSIFKKVNLISDEEYETIKFETMTEQKNGNYVFVPEKSYLLDGFFQTYLYINFQKEFILDLFKLSDEIMNEIANIYNKIKNEHKTTVSIHIRRGDYLKLSQFHVVLNKSYYDRAMKMFPEDSLFVVFSDDIAWCKENISSKNIHFVNLENEEIIKKIPIDVCELYLMSMCENNIIANSSFSWWAAWLNNNNNKKMIASSSWFVPSGANYNAVVMLLVGMFTVI